MRESAFRLTTNIESQTMQGFMHSHWWPLFVTTIEGQMLHTGKVRAPIPLDLRAFHRASNSGAPGLILLKSTRCLAGDRNVAILGDVKEPAP
jgi:hypothetical protein